MIRFLVRCLGFLLIAVGFSALIVDGTRTIAGGELTLTPLGQIALALIPNKFPLLQPAIERHIHPLLWDPVLATLFRLPAWLVAGVVGTLLLRAARRNEPDVGFDSRGH